MIRIMESEYTEVPIEDILEVYDELIDMYLNREDYGDVETMKAMVAYLGGNSAVQKNRGDWEIQWIFKHGDVKHIGTNRIAVNPMGDEDFASMEDDWMTFIESLVYAYYRSCGGDEYTIDELIDIIDEELDYDMG